MFQYTPCWHTSTFNIAFCDVWCSVVILSNPGAKMNVLWNALQVCITRSFAEKRKCKETFLLPTKINSLRFAFSNQNDIFFA